VWHSYGGAERAAGKVRHVGGVTVPAGTRVVTYVARGFESMRGFDIFMRAAALIGRRMPNVVFIVVGEDRHCYGGDENHIGPHKSFREWVLAREEFDLSRFVFTGRLVEGELARLLAATDLHIYLTAPFVLSWSCLNAMSCGAVVLGSDTPPVREVVEEGRTGLLADFFSPERIAARALEVLAAPGDFAHLGRAAEAMVAERYAVEAVMPKMLGMYERAMAAGGERIRPTRGV
jgi:glycosyltransferase involved in cell wall biosynthesis